MILAKDFLLKSLISTPERNWENITILSSSVKITVNVPRMRFRVDESAGCGTYDLGGDLLRSNFLSLSDFLVPFLVFNL